MLAAFLADAMSTLKSRMNRDESGATAVEYGIMVALIAVVIIVGVTLVGDNLLDLFNDVGGKIAPTTTTTTAPAGT